MIAKFFTEIYDFVHNNKEVTLAFIGLFASVIGALTYIQKKGEGKSAVDKNFSETIKALLELNTDNAMFHADKSGKYPKNYSRVINDKRRFFVRQAEYLSKRASRISPYEYMVMAEAFNSIDDASQAEIFFPKAIEGSKNDIERCITLRTYGRFLFGDGRPEEGEAAYEKAAAICRNANDDRHRSYEADTYLRVAEHHAEWGNMKCAILCLNTAYNIYCRLDNPTRKDRETTRVAEVGDRLGIKIDSCSGNLSPDKIS